MFPRTDYSDEKTWTSSRAGSRSFLDRCYDNAKHREIHRREITGSYSVIWIEDKAVLDEADAAVLIQHFNTLRERDSIPKGIPRNYLLSADSKEHGTFSQLAMFPNPAPKFSIGDPKFDKIAVYPGGIPGFIPVRCNDLLSWGITRCHTRRNANEAAEDVVQLHRLGALAERRLTMMAEKYL